MKLLREFTRGLWKENPVLRLLIGLCPTLAVTTTAINGFGMGASTLFVLVGSNMVIALMRNQIPDKIRIPSFIIVIATFVTIIDLVLAGFAYDLHKALGIFIPLIVVNCIILGRAEAYASKNPVLRSFVDGLGMGVGFTLTLTVLGAVREILGNGTIFGYVLFGPKFLPMLAMVLPPGAFISLGFFLAAMNKIDAVRASRQKRPRVSR